MTSATDVVAAMTAALVGRTAAGDRIAVPGDLPLQPDQFPALKVRIVAEGKTSTGRGTIGFTTLVTIRVQGEVSEPVDPDDDLLVATTMAKLLVLKRQAERAIIGDGALFRVVQQLASVTTQFAYGVQAQRLAGIQSDYVFEIYEGAEDFAAIEDEPIDAIDLAASHYPPAGLTASLPL